MAETRPTGEQLRFISSATGEHILDTYLENTEKGGRSLPDLLDDLFDSQGVFSSENFEFRIDPTTRRYQVRIGVYANNSTGWLDIPNGFVFRQRGNYAVGVAYEQTDIVKVGNNSYICLTAHTSVTVNPDVTKFGTVIDASYLDTAISTTAASAAAAASSASSASSSATSANSSKVDAAASAAAALASSTSAASSASTATTQASNSSASATAAAASQSAASASQSAAAASQSAAATSAAAALASETAAASSASAAASSASSASSSAATATTQATDSAASASLANDWATKTSGTVAGGEYSAKYHAQQSASSASASASSASAAASSASGASSSATTALGAQTAAEAARDATLAAFDSFDDRYLGAKTSDPTVDNDGNALVAGSLYFNSASGDMKIYTGTAWVAAYVSGSGFVLKTGDTMTGALTLPGAPTSNNHAATKKYVDDADALKADLASPALTGTPTAPTASVDTNTTQIATTAYVIGQDYTKSSYVSATFAPLISPSFTGAVTASGVIESTSGGFKFPDGTTQTTSAAVKSFNTRTGDVTLTSTDVTDALTYTPLNKAGDTITGNLAFSGTALRITGDFTSSTLTNRTSFQTSTANSQTLVQAIPNGSSAVGGFIAHNNSNPTNASSISVSITDQAAFITSGKSGTGDYLPIAVSVGGTQRLTFEIDGSIKFNTTVSINIPRGPTSSRPALPENGDFRLNTDTAEIEYYDGTKSVWRSFGQKTDAATALALYYFAR